MLRLEKARRSAFAAESSATVEQHIALLIDLLGFSDAVLTWNTEDTDTLLHFVERISILQGSFNLDGESTPEGGYKFHGIRPEVTTFSDLLFASFPVPEADMTLTPIITDMWLQEIERWTGVIAAEALKIGMLVRGGLVLGPLHHDQARSITFGPALVEAHELESRQAVHPRVLLSKRLCATLADDQKQRLLCDKDGLLHLDYFKAMFNHAVQGPDFVENARLWLKAEIEKIDANSARLSRLGHARQAAKWEWFKSALLSAGKRRGVTATAVEPGS